MRDYASQVQKYLDDLKKGEGDNAFFDLLEMSHDALPEIIAACKREPAPDVRTLLVKVIWQHRQPSVIPFLVEVLHDPNKEVWKQALKGLVALASPQVVAALLSARTRQFRRERDAEDFRRWIDEAIEQVEEMLKRTFDMEKRCRELMRAGLSQKH